MAETHKDGESQLYRTVVDGLRSIGYDGALLAEDYKFGDWFSRDLPERTIAAAAFGQTPRTSASACFGVVVANGESHSTLVTKYRALGAPIIFEIGSSVVREWVVGPSERKSKQLGEYGRDELQSRFVTHAPHWNPIEFLRAKNIGKFTWNRRLKLFVGLLPELEQEIQGALVPLLKSTLSATVEDYRAKEGREPDPQKMFQLIFWLLTGKVFHDCDIRGFRSLDTSSADDVLTAVAKHYRTDPPRLLLKSTRDVAFEHIWCNEMDFRNLSVDVLADTWSKALVTDEDRVRLGIHRTSRTLATYVVNRIPFDGGDDNHKTVFEPCCGSSVFLVAAMQRLRTMLWGLSPQARHDYFIEHLVGMDVDPFGREISWLVLTLADFPNANGWKVRKGDVFDSSRAMAADLQRAGIVLCNPPFEDFTKTERRLYRATSLKKPAELVLRILEDLNPSGVLGLVLPRNIVDGQGYDEVRRSLAQRFSSLEITILPDKAFDADHEVAIVIATAPIPHDTVTVRYRRIRDTSEDWQRFVSEHAVSSEDTVQLDVQRAAESLAIPELREVWEYLSQYPQLQNVAEMHRGIQWKLKLTKTVNGRRVETGNRDKLVRSTPHVGFKLGVPPETHMECLTVPPLAYLDYRKDSADNKAWKYNWDKPKVFLNAGTKSRHGWRMAAFADTIGLAGYQNTTGVWPLNLDVHVLAAVLVGPVANAFVATREGKRHVTIETLRGVPVPHFSKKAEAQIREFVVSYQALSAQYATDTLRPADADSRQRDLLMQIDAAVLEAYRLPPKMERQILNFFSASEDTRQDRPVPYTFGDYFPATFTACFSLKDWLTGRHTRASKNRFLATDREAVPREFRDAMQLAVTNRGEGDD